MYKALDKENQQLKKTNQRLSETMTQVQTRLAQFEQRTKTLAIAAGVSDLLGTEDAAGRARSAAADRWIACPPSPSC